MNIALSNENSISSSPSVLSTFPVQDTDTKTGYVLTTVTAVLSTICSFLILNSIRMSNQKLTTTYHRMMAFMSLFDIMASVCMALTTLPMPSDDMLRFAGPMLGNKTTCQTQGYFIVLGLAGGGALYMCLSWYFVCRMTFQMSFDNIRSKVEPVLYIYSAAKALFLPSYMLSNDLIHALPRSSFCVIGPAHSQCDYSLEKKYLVCDFDVLDKFKVSLDITKALLGFNIVMIVFAMTIIIWTIWNKNKEIKHNLETNEEHLEREIKLSEMRYSRMLVIQALMYIFTYVTTWTFMIVPMVMSCDEKTTDILLLFKSIFFPLQGFWNLVIFVYDKTYLVYRDNGNQSLCSIIKIVLFRPYNVPEIILPATLMHQTTEEKSTLQDSELDCTGPVHKLNSITEVHGNGEFLDDLGGSNMSDSSISSTSVIRCEEVEFLWKGHHRYYYIRTNGLKRTGLVEDRRQGRIHIHSSDSIESPVGDYSNSADSNLRMMIFRQYSLNTIDEEE